MSRPKKWRKVCCMPKTEKFGPWGQAEAADYTEDDNRVIMSVEEYETIRLIDYESYTQIECAEHMHIARTTVQRIYNDARKKIADAIVNGKLLKIKGGDYRLCDGEHGRKCGRPGCHMENS